MNMQSLGESGAGYSRLSRCLPPRTLPIALAQEVANTPLGDTARLQLLGRLFNGLRPGDKMRCKVELKACRLAKQGHLEAVVR